MSPAPDADASAGKKSKRKNAKGKGKALPSSEVSLVSVDAATHIDARLPSWSWAVLADSQSSRCPPLFTRDAKYFFVASASAVKIYSVATTRVISTLNIQASSDDADSAKSPIVSLLIHPKNPFQLVTASQDGRIRIWDFLDGVLLQTIDTGLIVSHMAVASRDSPHVLVVGRRSSESQSALFRIRVEATTTSTSKDLVQSLHAHFGHESVTAFAVSPSGSSVVAISGKKVFVVQMHSSSSNQPDETSPHRPLRTAQYSSPTPLTCLAFHPSDQIFATGDAEGVIRLWFCLDPENRSYRKSTSARGHQDRSRTSNAPTSTMHWHAHAVGALVFSPNGAYLLSGGEESVLVIWQLDSAHKEFIPRLGSPIEHITIAPTSSNGGGSGYLLGLADGGLSLVDSQSLKVSRTFVQLKRTSRPHASASELDSPIPLTIHPSTSHLILPSSHPSSIQVYSPHSSELISELEVSPSNRVSRRDDTPIEQARVTRVAISASGEWMATVDVRNGGTEFSDEIVLKIWRWEEQSGSTKGWVLNSRVDRPHDKTAVTSLAFCPKVLSNEEGCLLLTAGDNGQTRLWRSHRAGEDVYWAARSSFSYRNTRPSSPAVWSPDGSLIAVAHGPTVTVWAPTGNTLVTSLASVEIDSVTAVSFLGASGRYLATYSGSRVVLWDLLGGSIVWDYRIVLGQSILVPHPTAEIFALIGTLPTPSSSKKNASVTTTFMGKEVNASSDSIVAVFSASSSRPTSCYTVPFALRHAIWYGSTANDRSSSPSSSSPSYSLLGITRDQTTVLFGDNIAPPTREGATGREIAQGAGDAFAPPSLFRDMFGTSAFASLEERRQVEAIPSVPASVTATGTRVLNLEILDGPAHLLPPIASLFDSLMSSFVPSERTRVEVGDAKASGDEDHVMQDADEVDEDNIDTKNGRTTVAARHHARRKVDEEEMLLFTEFFRTSLSTTSPVATPSSLPPNTPSNGKVSLSNGTPTTATPNGHGKAVITNGNGKIHSPSSAASPTKNKKLAKVANGVPAPSPLRNESVTSGNTSPGPVTGQKRKKTSA